MRCTSGKPILHTIRGHPGWQPPSAGDDLQDEVEAAIGSPTLAPFVFGSVSEAVQRHLLLHRQAHQHQQWWQLRLQGHDPIYLGLS